MLDEIESRGGVISVPKRQIINGLKNQADREKVENILTGVASLDWRHTRMEHFGQDYTMGECAHASDLRVSEDLHEKLAREETAAIVQKLIRKLPRVEKVVIWLRLRSWPITAVADTIKMSHESVRKLEKRGKLRLKKMLEARGLGSFE
jgi:DNA-directed RNA polymerase specialized sigma24 family protein